MLSIYCVSLSVKIKREPEMNECEFYGYWTIQETLNVLLVDRTELTVYGSGL